MIQQNKNMVATVGVIGRASFTYSNVAEACEAIAAFEGAHPSVRAYKIVSPWTSGAGTQVQVSDHDGFGLGYLRQEPI